MENRDRRFSHSRRLCTPTIALTVSNELLNNGCNQAVFTCLIAHDCLIGVSIDPGRIFRTRAERNPSPFVTYTKHPRFSLQKKAYRRMTPAWLHIVSILSLGLGASLAVVIVLSERRDPQHMAIMNLVWPAS